MKVNQFETFMSPSLKFYFSLKIRVSDGSSRLYFSVTSNTYSFFNITFLMITVLHSSYTLIFSIGNHNCLLSSSSSPLSYPPPQTTDVGTNIIHPATSLPTDLLPYGPLLYYSLPLLWVTNGSLWVTKSTEPNRFQRF